MTGNDVLVIPGSGTYAMESAVANLVVARRPRARRLGRQLRRAMAEAGDARYGARAWCSSSSRGASGWIRRASGEAAAGCRVAFVTQSETSTGVVHDVRAIADAVRPSGAALVVDAVSSLGGVELRTDEWGIDVVVSGSQKALMCPPGLAFASVSERAWELAADGTRAALRVRLAADRRRAGQGHGTPFTPPVTIVAGLNAALELLERDGYEAAYARNRRLARADPRGRQGAGAASSSRRTTTPRPWSRPFACRTTSTARRSTRCCATATASCWPAVRARCAGSIIRIGHMGYMDRFDILTALAALELALRGVRTTGRRRPARASPGRPRCSRRASSPVPGCWSRSRSPRPASSSCAAASTSTWTSRWRPRICPSGSATTTR